jgi:YD repeat-containing protein
MPYFRMTSSLASIAAGMGLFAVLAFGEEEPGPIAPGDRPSMPNTISFTRDGIGRPLTMSRKNGPGEKDADVYAYRYSNNPLIDNTEYVTLENVPGTVSETYNPPSGIKDAGTEMGVFGQIIVRTDPNGNKTIFRINRHSQMAQIAYKPLNGLKPETPNSAHPDHGRTVKYTYAPFGGRDRPVAGIDVVLFRDGKQETQTHYAATFYGDGKTRTLSIGLTGRVLAFEYLDFMGRITKQTCASGKSVEWTREYPGKGVRAWPEKIVSREGGTESAFKLSYDPGDRLERVDLPSGATLEWKYGFTGHPPVEFGAFDGKSVLCRFVSVEKHPGVRTGWEVYRGGTVEKPVKVRTYGRLYNEGDRLKGEQVLDGSGKAVAEDRFVMGRFGDMLEHNPGDARNTVTRRFTYFGRLQSEVRGGKTTEYAWDGNGNCFRAKSPDATVRYEWDMENRLFRMTREAPGAGFVCEFIYVANTPLIAEVRLTPQGKPTVSRRYLYGAVNERAAEYDGQNALLRSFIVSCDGRLLGAFDHSTKTLMEHVGDPAWPAECWLSRTGGKPSIAYLREDLVQGREARPAEGGLAPGAFEGPVTGLQYRGGRFYDPRATVFLSLPAGSGFPAQAPQRTMYQYAAE